MGRWLSHLHHFDAYLEQQRKGFWNTIPSAFASDSLGKKV
jgi:hypothetical protein